MEWERGDADIKIRQTLNLTGRCLCKCVYDYVCLHMYCFIVPLTTKA